MWPEGPPPSAFHTVLPIRFSDGDGQGIVFNAHYLRFCDNAVEDWFEAIPSLAADAFWDFVVKRAELEWTSPARPGDRLDVAVWPARWGRTSFTIGLAGSVGERPVFTASLVYVTIDQDTGEAVVVPERLRAALETGA